MRRISCILFFLLTAQLFAQQSSNLFQIIASDLPIERNEAFRELETFLDNENSKQIKGVDLAILHQLVDNCRDTILGFIDPLQVNVDGDIYTITYKNKSILKLKVDNNQSINDIIKNLEAVSTGNIGKTIVQLEEKILPGNEKLGNIVIYACYTMIEKGEIKKFDYNNSGVYSDSIAAAVSQKLSGLAKNALLNYINETTLNIPIGKIAAENIPKINDQLILLSNYTRDETVNLFDKIHNIIINEVEKPLSSRLKGITGFSLTQASGMFSGGIIYGFRKNDWRLSFYTNANFSSTQDSAVHSLIGGRLGFISNRVQFDALYAIYFGDKEFKIWNAFEFGGSINYSLNGGTVIGLAYFYTENGTPGKEWIEYSAGLMIKISESAPSVVLGLKSEVGWKNFKPIFQISYPINTNL